MSFMFKPLKYDDWTAVNTPDVKHIPTDGIRFTTESSMKELLCKIEDGMKNGKKRILIDGYVGADFPFVEKYLQENLHGKVRFIQMESLVKAQDKIDEMTKDCLPMNLDEDPVLLFGKLFHGGIEDLLDLGKVADFNQHDDGVVVVVGNGAASKVLRTPTSLIVFIDVIPKNTAVRAREGKFKNIGDQKARPFMMLMRRNYFVDFEVVIKLRRELVRENLIDVYMLDSDEAKMLMDGETMKSILTTLSAYPFRAKPVYLEGIWGGEFIRKIRNLPKDMSENIAWIFEFIPMEVSILVEVDKQKIDFPFSTFMQVSGEAILGQRAYRKFEGYFPIRFNYDDSYHSDGNMSIQVHPDEDFVIENYREFGRQDEAYYVIATGHKARTYVGFRKDADAREFMELAKQSEKDGRDIDYKKYINSVESRIGTQVMLPAGTVHSSGQNQFILELGSLTIGSYTYKVYDYNRRDKEGTLRPIHTVNAEKVLGFDRTEEWVKKHSVIDPILKREGKGYQEEVVGRNDLMYYETSRIEIQKKASVEDSNRNQFTVLTLVDGEEIIVRSKANPERSYRQKFLEIVVVPASIGDFVIENVGYQPCVVHKTYLKENYTRYKNHKEVAE